jgi:hypothetical protein
MTLDAQCHSGAFCNVMLSAVRLMVVLLSVVAPFEVVRCKLGLQSFTDHSTLGFKNMNIHVIPKIGISIANVIKLFSLHP